MNIVTTISIDPDEEITSILGRLRRVKANGCLLVTPKGALLLGSIINLRLLKRESERIGLAVAIVTQDEQGIALCEKAEVDVMRSIPPEVARLGSVDVSADRTYDIPTSASPQALPSPPHTPGVARVRISERYPSENVRSAPANIHFQENQRFSREPSSGSSVEVDARALSNEESHKSHKSHKSDSLRGDSGVYEDYQETHEFSDLNQDQYSGIEDAQIDTTSSEPLRYNATKPRSLDAMVGGRSRRVLSGVAPWSTYNARPKSVHVLNSPVPGAPVRPRWNKEWNNADAPLHTQPRSHFPDYPQTTPSARVQNLYYPQHDISTSSDTASLEHQQEFSGALPDLSGPAIAPALSSSTETSSQESPSSSSTQYTRDREYDERMEQLESFFGDRSRQGSVLEKNKGKRDNVRKKAKEKRSIERALPVSSEKRQKPDKKTNRRRKGESRSKHASKMADTHSVSKRVRMALILFIFLGLLLILGVLVYVFIPKTFITVAPQQITQSKEVEFLLLEESGGNGKNKEGLLENSGRFTVREEKIDKEKSFRATGDGEGGSQKSRGTITIYNNGNQPQPLVATTRFESPDGKIFRLREDVVVPAQTTNTNGSIVPGTLETEVQADRSGESYNIKPTTFTLPGLKGTGKFDSITAKSEVAFVGGVSGDSVYSIVTEEDVVGALDILIAEIKAEFAEGITENYSIDVGTAERLIYVDIKDPVVQPVVGVASESFLVHATGVVYIAEFSERELLESMLSSTVDQISESSGVEDWRAEMQSVEYSKIEWDRESERLVVRLKQTGEFTTIVNTEQLRQDILGKSVEEAQKVIEDHGTVEEIGVEFSPRFYQGGIPILESRVFVEVDEEN